MVLKVGVVQTPGVITKDTEREDLDTIDDLLKTVSHWCGLNGWTHCVVPQPSTEYNLFRATHQNSALRKYEACASVSENFDYLVYLDADILCWGNPRIPIGDDFWMVRHLVRPLQGVVWDDGKLKPQSYFMCGPAEQFKSLYSWILDQCEERTRDREVECDYQLERRNSIESRHSYPKGVKMTDETLLRHWIDKQSVRWIPSNSLVHDFYLPGDIHPNQLLHLGGREKFKTYTFVKQLIYYYKRDKRLFNHLRDVKNQLLYTPT